LEEKINHLISFFFRYFVCFVFIVLYFFFGSFFSFYSFFLIRLIFFFVLIFKNLFFYVDGVVEYFSSFLMLFCDEDQLK